MNIHSDYTSLPSANHVPAGQAKSHRFASDAPAPQTLSDAPAEPTDTFESPRPAKGVLRLLEAGHFRGVADVRLRINFQQELSAQQGQSLPELSSPAGQGKAYAKFLQMYQAMQSPPADQPPVEPPTDGSGTPPTGDPADAAPVEPAPEPAAPPATEAPTDPVVDVQASTFRRPRRPARHSTCRLGRSR